MLSSEHRPSHPEEKDRILKAGGKVNEKQDRIEINGQGGLAMSRSLVNLKKNIHICDTKILTCTTCFTTREIFNTNAIQICRLKNNKLLLFPM